MENKLKIGFFGVSAEEELDLRKLLGEKKVDVEPSFYPNILDSKNLPEVKDFDAVSVFVDSTIDSSVIEALPKLSFVALRATGFDKIDLELAKKRNITVSNVPSYGENTVAEYAFALLLSLSRKIYEGYDRIRETGSFSFEGLKGFDLKGKTLGVVGTGRIGRHVVKIATGFGMNIIAYDPYPNAELQKEFGFEYLSLDELLAKSDIVTLHVPYTKESHHLLNASKFSLMKKGAYIINTSRGGLIDTEAMVAALQSGHLGGAGLDVLEEEDVIKDEMRFLQQGGIDNHNVKTILANHVLIDMPNVIITPHNAFNTKEALLRISETTITNIEAFVAGAPVNIVGKK